jgi:hypothetical protein
MKKILVLLLVLSIASLANALIVTLDPSGSGGHAAGTVTVNVVSDSDDISYDYFVKVEDITYGDISAITILPDAGADAVTQDFGDALGAGTRTVRINALDQTPGDGPEDVFAGVHFSVDIGFTGNAVGEDLTLSLLDGSLGTIGSYTVQGIPEPMTVALLGFGGLFVRRRKQS